MFVGGTIAQTVPEKSIEKGFQLTSRRERVDLKQHPPV
jgi:hypothetical protein